MSMRAGRNGVRCIGLLGGTFDPVHHGHLRPLEEVREALSLSDVRLLPARVPPHRAVPQRPAHVRAGLLREAVEGDPNLWVDDRELQRPGPSYTVDTLAELRADLPDASLCLILGADSYVTLPEWSRWQRLGDLAHLIVTTRPGYPDPEGAPILREWAAPRLVDAAQAPTAIRSRRAGLVIRMPVTPVDISATSIRRALACGRSVRRLMPESARRRAVGEGLYGYPQL